MLRIKNNHRGKPRQILLMGVLILSLLLSTLSGCSESDPYKKDTAVESKVKKGAVVEAKVQADKETIVGSRSKTGWELQIPAGAFSENASLTMNVLAEEKVGTYEAGGFTLYGTPVEISVNGKHNVRLAQPVALTMQIPKGLLKDMSTEELFFACYYDGKWEYYMPDSINIDKGTATINTYHFSFWGFGRPSEEDQIKTYAKNYASLQWENGQKTKKLTDSLGRQFDDLFASMGVSSNSVRNQLTADVISYLENASIESGGVAPIDALAQMANAASKGQEGMQDFQNKLLEFTGKGLTACLEEIHNAGDKKYTEKFASSVNILGNLSSALGYISEGDSQGALESVANMLKGVHPVVALTSSTLDFIKDSAESAIDYWTQEEIEKAYQVYIGSGAGKYGYDSGLEGDIDAIFTTLGGGERMMNIKIIKKYCEKYGINESELTQEDKDRITSNALKALKNNFDYRKVSEPEIEKIKQKEEAFIAALKAKGLLSASAHQKIFGIDKSGGNFNIKDRLAKLYHLKALVLRYVDADIAAKLNDDQLATIIEQWIHWSEKKDRASFFKYLREAGYNKEPIVLNSDYAWVLASVKDDDNAKGWAQANESPVYSYLPSYGRGSYSMKWTYKGESDDYYDPPYVHGESYTVQAKWSTPPSTLKPGEVLSLNVSLSITANTLSAFKPGGHTRAYLNGIDFVSSNGKTGGYSISPDKTSLNDTVSAAVPAGSQDGDQLELEITFHDSVSMSTTYIYEWKEQ